MPNSFNPPDLKSNSQGAANSHPTILRVSAFITAGALAMLMVTAVAPPIVADQSDRAVVNAHVTLLTAPISGEIASLNATPGADVERGEALAVISNPRVDRTTLIALEEKITDARERLVAARAKKESDHNYLASLDTEISNQTEQLKNQFKSQIEGLRAKVEASRAMSSEKKALVDRQNNMVARNAASIEMVKPTTQQYSAALHSIDAASAKLNQKVEQLNALNRGIFVGDDLVAINTLVQKRRDIDLDAKRLDIEEKQLSAVLDDWQPLVNAERKRLDSLSRATVAANARGRVMMVGAASGRHVNAGDTIASLVDCSKSFVVGIFSYRQGETMRVGTRVKIDGSKFHSGTVTAVLPKTNDKSDERYAVPFPQTERRELYVIVSPDKNDLVEASASDGDPQSDCAVGRWVTVTRDNGIVPSMSVTWHKLGEFVAFWNHDDNSSSTKQAKSDNKPGQQVKAVPAVDQTTRKAGLAQLRAASEGKQKGAQKNDDWPSPYLALLRR
jgi:multidrug resistance efflux pump